MRPATLLPVIALMALAPALRAHEHPVERGVLVQIERAHLDLMITYEQPAGPPVDLLMERFDLDRDGRLRGPEVTLAGQTWLGPALSGIELEVEGQAPAMHTPEIKIKHTEGGGVALAAFVRYDLKGADAHRVTLRLSDAPHTLHTTAYVRAGEGFALVPNAGREAPARIQIGPMRLDPGAELVIEARRAPSPTP